MSTKPRVFVTGMGAVTPLGVGISDFWNGVKEGRSGIVRVDDRFDLEGIKSKIGAPVLDFDPTEHIPQKRVRRLGRSVQFVLISAGEALKQAGISDPDERTGAVVGTGIGDIKALTENHKKLLDRGARRVSPFFIPQLMPNAPTAQISIEYGFEGPNYGAVSACSSGTHAVGLAADVLRSGRADVMLAGGAEAPMLSLAYAGFDRIGALSTRNDQPEKASRPFDADRDGFVIGEGAGILVLETERHLDERGKDPIAEIVGFGASADSHHITSPPEDGHGARNSMARALEDGGLKPTEVDYINAHGTSTPLNDKVETKAIKDLFGDHAYRIPVSSVKSQIGHLVVAAGAVEAISCCMALQDGYIPPTLNYENRDEECDLDYNPGKGMTQDISVALSNSFGFGGQNGTLVFRKP